MKKRTIIIVSVVAAVLLALAAAYVIEQYYRLEVCNFESIDGESHGYYVYPNATADSVIALMQEDYKIASMSAWKRHQKRLYFKSPKAGYYKFPARIGDKHLIRRLQFGQQSPCRLTFNNYIRTREQLAGRLGQVLLLDSLDVLLRLESDEYMAKYGMNKENSRCLFIPNTYEVYWTISVDDLFNRMYAEYNNFWTETRRHKADSLHLTPIEVATLASIVESETRNKAELDTIASLYLNRLRKGMALQACPTVIYATGNLKLKRVLKRHLAIDSPYNTYKYKGLPPGPIRCPNGSTIDAVLNAPKTNYLYMCANPDWSGRHIFSNRYSIHAEAARQYQRVLNEKAIR